MSANPDMELQAPNAGGAAQYAPLHEDNVVPAVQSNNRTRRIMIALGVVGVVLAVVIAVSVTVLSHSDTSDERMFKDFMKTYNKSYKTKEEYDIRFTNFQSSLKRIAALNARPGVRATFGTNAFSDLTPDEFARTYLSPLRRKSLEEYQEAAAKAAAANSHQSKKATVLSAQVDWNAAGKVTEVKMQNPCNSCWAFSAAATIESLIAINGGPLGDLSPQQLIDCRTDITSQQCETGGHPNLAYAYIQGNGLCSLSDYPFIGADEPCNAANCAAVQSSQISSYSAVATGEYALGQAVTNQPVLIGVDATQWQDYTGGVMDAATCAFSSYDHAVTLVGYGPDPFGQNTDTWEIKNSWSTAWGVNGYIYVARNAASNSAGACGIGGYAWYPIA